MMSARSPHFLSFHLKYCFANTALFPSPAPSLIFYCCKKCKALKNPVKSTAWDSIAIYLPFNICNCFSHSLLQTSSDPFFFVLSAVLLHGEESCCCCCCCHHLTISSFASWNLSLKLISQLWTVPFKSSRGFKALEDKNCDTGQRPVAVISSHAQAQLQWSHCSPHYLEMVQKPDWYSCKYMNSPQCATRDW